MLFDNRAVFFLYKAPVFFFRMASHIRYCLLKNAYPTVNNRFIHRSFVGIMNLWPKIQNLSTNSVPQLYTVLKITGFCYRFVSDKQKSNRGLLENCVNQTCIFPIVKCSFRFSEDGCIWIYSKKVCFFGNTRFQKWRTWEKSLSKLLKIDLFSLVYEIRFTSVSSIT